MIHNTKYQIQNAGFTILFALIVVSILLMVGLAVSGIILKEMILSSAGFESQKAFYAADTGTECALYWEIKRDAIHPGEPALIDCDNQSVSVGETVVSSFELRLQDGSCVNVIIDKSNPLKVIEARGYNVDCGASNLQKVERGLRITY